MLTAGQVCALLSDLEILEDGDQSEIGERGVSCLGYIVACLGFLIHSSILG